MFNRVGGRGCTSLTPLMRVQQWYRQRHSCWYARAPRPWKGKITQVSTASPDWCLAIASSPHHYSIMWWKCWIPVQTVINLRSAWLFVFSSVLDAKTQVNEDPRLCLHSMQTAVQSQKNTPRGEQVHFSLIMLMFYHQEAELRLILT